MMIEKTAEPTRCYAPKEIALFDATLRLLSAGRQLHDLKISEIATEAGIGKGTVYEYFESKETLIAHTLLYCLEEEGRRGGELISAATGFREAVFVMFDVIRANLANPMSSFWLLSSGMSTIHRLMPRTADQDACKKSLAQSRAQVGRMLALGRAEGLVRADIDEDVAFLALKGAAAAYLTPPLTAQWGDEALRETSYQLLLKMLA